MSGPIFAIPSLEGLREAREIATPASTPRRASSDRRDALGTILYLGCIALVGALTACTVFGAAFYLVAHPTDKVISPTGGTPVSRRFPALAPVIRAGGSALPQPGYPGATGQSAELARLASIASAFIAEPEPLPARAEPKSRAETVCDRLGANHIRPGYRGHRCDDLGCRRPNCSSLGDPAMVSNPAAILDRSESPGKCRGPD